MKMRERWVIKVGSNIVCSGGLLLLRSWMQQLAHLRKKHRIEVIWVTSGAIATAVEKTGFNKRNRLLPEKQALSAIGQPLLMDSYHLALQANQLMGAQILLTYSDFQDRTRLTNFRHTVKTLLKWGVVPILNENDAVATEEIKFGDNDALSALVARFTRSDRLIILTDVDGLYHEDPRKNPKAKFIKKLTQIPSELLHSLSPESPSGRGTGGMLSKLKAAQRATEAGIPTYLIKGDVPHALLQLAEGKSVGTMILGQKKNRRSKK